MTRTYHIQVEQKEEGLIKRKRAVGWTSQRKEESPMVPLKKKNFNTGAHGAGN